MAQLETVVGSLLQGYQQLVPSTVLTSAELLNEYRANPDGELERQLKQHWFWTSNFTIYKLESGREVVYLGSKTANPIFANIGEAATQLGIKKDYLPSRTEIQAALASGSTKKFLVSALGLKEYNGEFSYFDVDPVHYDSLNPSPRAFSGIVFGTGKDFSENMLMLARHGKEKVRVYVLNPKYLRAHLRAGEDIARASFFYYFGKMPVFNSSARDVNNPHSAMRGKPKA